VLASERKETKNAPRTAHRAPHILLLFLHLDIFFSQDFNIHSSLGISMQIFHLSCKQFKKGKSMVKSHVAAII
jgi:hypothetical protein